MTRYRVGIDTGGTFTDVVAIDEETGRVLTVKTPSTPEDPSLALMGGLDKILSEAGIGRSSVAGLIHGTTVATNALLEERFQGLALVTTKGFKHILEIARQSVPSGYGNSYFWVKPERIVPLDRVFEVSERLNYRGEVIRPLSEEGVREVGKRLRTLNVEAVAICLIHAYANSDHERRVRGLLLEEYPKLVVSVSSDVLPEYREYERTVTTCIDAYVKPVMERYIERTGASLARSVPSDLQGPGAGSHERTAISGRQSSMAPATGNGQRPTANGRPPFLIMQSNGGVLSAREVVKKPITTLLSGPAAGALGAGYLAQLAGYDRVLTVDAGGTSTDICLVDGGAPHVTSQGSVGRFPIKLPMVDVATIGTGGGSIAWIDRSGGLRVGPNSAGADPGPMCYGRGGTEPTLTDANVALGRLPSELLGGEMPLDAELAWRGIETLAQTLGMERERAAAGVVEIADWNQVNAIRRVTVKKGLDPRSYTMVAFGGSGPLQAAHVAELLEIETVLVPPDPGNVSALGLLAVDLKSDYVTTCVQREDRADLTVLDQSFATLSDEADAGLAGQGVTPGHRRLLRTVDVRYLGEAYEISVPVPSGALDTRSLSEILTHFHEEHTRLYGYSYQGQQLCELVSLRVTGVGLIDRPAMIRWDGDGTESQDVTDLGLRQVRTVTGAENVAVRDRQSLPPGQVLEGPLLITEYGSTTMVPSGWRASADSRRNLILGRTNGSDDARRTLAAAMPVSEIS